eukprot:scaffold20468_cov73-Isochrysis_galbana.AAC.1
MYQAEVTAPDRHHISCGALCASPRSACLALCLGGGEGSPVSRVGPSIALQDMETSRVTASVEVNNMGTVARFEPRRNVLLVGGGDG